ncbi:MAG: tetratricopeptide repeat protein [Pseudorhodobacter sp.]|nr:tetratricopeptide repeat protein [Pseudorhodobacter sp.]
MKALGLLHNCIIAAFLLFALPAWADATRLDDLFQQLQTATDEEAGQITDSIWIEWSKSGSPAMDLLLKRGRDALAAGQPDLAIQHFTALIDHAPDFAEAYNARATAYYQTGDLGPSVSDIAKTLTLNPRHFGALAGLGAIFEQLDEPAKALEVYKAALAINPHMPDIKDAVKRLETSLGGQNL